MTINQYVKSVGGKKDVRAGLSSQEVGVIRYILEMRYLSLDQVKRRFGFANMEQFLKLLIKDGYLKCKDQEWVDKSIFTATKKAQEEIQKAFPDRVIPKVESNVFQARVNHDLLLNDLRIRFEDLGFISKWVSERQLRELPLFQRCFTDFPDAVCVKKNEKSYFLELEVSEKGPKQYRERIEGYLEILKKDEVKDAGIEGVIFFCVKDEVADKIKTQVPEGTKGISVLSYYNYFKPKKEKSEGAKPQTKNKEIAMAHV